LHELAVSIAAHGLLQSLVVRKHRKGKFAVVAGGRRLAALRCWRNPERSILPTACRARCSAAIDAIEISLAENSVR